MTLDELAKKIEKCKKCPLFKTRNKPVSGEGNPHAKIVFIGEAPGQQEDKQGKPFIGSAGKFLDKLLAIAKLKRADVFITNILKCRPPQNRDPLPEEIKACWPYLKEQIQIIKPKLIITLGRYAMYKFLPETLKISQDHGKIFKLISKKTKKYQFYYPVYHPAAALYQGNLKEILEEDFAKIPKVLAHINKQN